MAAILSIPSTILPNVAAMLGNFSHELGNANATLLNTATDLLNLVTELRRVAPTLPKVLALMLNVRAEIFDLTGSPGESSGHLDICPAFWYFFSFDHIAADLNTQALNGRSFDRNA